MLRMSQVIGACASLALALAAGGCGGSDTTKTRTATAAGPAGGLLGAIAGDPGGSPVVAAIDRHIAAAVGRTRSDPSDPAPWAQAAGLIFQRANIDGIATDGTWTAAGLRRLRFAAQAWERYLALAPKHPDARVARLMVQAYGVNALNELSKAVQAQRIVTAAQRPPSSALYAQLAQLAYEAGDARTGDRAADRAVALGVPADRKALRRVLGELKSQASARPPATP